MTKWRVKVLTKGWDTISLVKQDKVNEPLRENWKLINSHFNYADPNDKSTCIQGEFNCWELLNGGGGRLLNFKLPIKSGVLCVKDNLKFDLKGTAAIVIVTLSVIYISISNM